MNRVKSILYGIFVGLITGPISYLVLSKMLRANELNSNGALMPPELWSAILHDAAFTGGSLGIIVGAIYGMRASIPRRPGNTGCDIGIIVLFVTWSVALGRFGGNGFHFPIWYIVSCIMVMAIVPCIILPAIWGFLNKFEPSSLFRDTTGK